MNLAPAIASRRFQGTNYPTRLRINPTDLQLLHGAEPNQEVISRSPLNHLTMHMLTGGYPRKRTLQTNRRGTL